jgi:colicin import membrane protein
MTKATPPTEDKAPSTALALPEKKDLQVAFEDGTVDALIGRIEKEVAAFVPDLSTAKSRGEITTLAATVARSKRPLDDARKSLTEDWRDKTAKVNVHWKAAETRLDALRDSVKKPLIEWEAIDTKRKEKQRSKLFVFNPERTDHTMSVHEIDVIVAQVASLDIDESWEEFKTMAENALDTFLAAAEKNRMFADIREKQAAQIAQLQKDKAEREEADRIANEAEIVAKEAADKAAAIKAEEDAAALLKEAEAKAKADREAEALEQAKVKAEQDLIRNNKAAISLMDYITACGKGMIGPLEQPYAMIIYELRDKIPAEIEKLAKADQPRARQHRENVLEIISHKKKVGDDRIQVEHAEAALVAEKEAAERTKAAEQAAIDRTKEELAAKIAKDAENQAAEAARLLSDDKHRKAILSVVTKDLKAFDVKDMAQAILDGKIRHVTIQL